MLWRNRLTKWGRDTRMSVTAEEIAQVYKT